MSAGQLLRDAGIARVSCGREDWIVYARAVAVEVAEARAKSSLMMFGSASNSRMDFPRTHGGRF